MPTIIAFAGQKGGAGKSTLAIAAATEFHRRSRRTLLVDADQQGTAATWGTVASEVADEDPEYTYPDVIMMGPNLHQQLPSIAAGYDIVIIDCPGRDDERQRGALAVADIAILPVTPDTSDVWALSHSVALVKQAQMFRPTLKAFLLLNKLRASTSEASEARETFAEADVSIMATEIGLRIAYGRFANSGRGVIEFAARSKAAEEISTLVDEIEHFVEPRLQEVVNG